MMQRVLSLLSVLERAVVALARRALRLRSGSKAAEASILEQIHAQLAANPGQPLRLEAIRTDDPPEPVGTIRFAAGAEDALFGTGRGNDGWRTVREAIRSIREARIRDWRQLDAAVGSIRAASAHDDLVDQVEEGGITRRVRALFWQLATRSRRIESVKWGIALGAGATATDVEQVLLALARHAEFTLYAVHWLWSIGERRPGLRRRLLDLLADTRQWGTVRLVDFIVSDRALCADAAVQRQLVVHGMRNHDGIPMELAFTIAKAVELRRLMQQSLDDAQLFAALADLMETLLLQPDPLGGLRDLDGWEAVYDDWVLLLAGLPGDIVVVWSLRCLRRFLDDEAGDWMRSAVETERLQQLWRTKFGTAALRDALAEERHCWKALVLIDEGELRELLPDVRRLHARTCSWNGIDVLGKLGGEAELQLLLDSIPKLVDPEARRRQPFLTQNTCGPGHQGNKEYGAIVRWLGRLPTLESVAAIREALGDYDPHVRARACEAAAELPGHAVDESLRTAIRHRLGDAPPYVVEAATRAAAAHGIEPRASS